MFILSIIVGLICSISFAQGPYAMSIGSGAGSLSFTNFYALGYVEGDDGTFYYDATNNATSVWNLCFYICNTANPGTEGYWIDKAGFSAHTSRPVNGTIIQNSTQITNTGMTFGSTANLTCDLQITLSQPLPNTENIAKVTWVYTFKNNSGSPLNLRMIMFLDGDMYFPPGGSYTDEIVGATQSDFGAYRTLCQGDDNGSGLVDLNKGVKIDCDNTIDRFFGLSNNTGPSYFWSNQAPYNPNGPEAVYKIADIYANTVENDAGGDKLSDSQRDSGIAIQSEFEVPAGSPGQKAITFTATWGLDQTYSEVTEWDLY